MEEAETLLKQEVMFGDTYFHLLEDLSRQEEAASPIIHMVRGLHLPILRGPLGPVSLGVCACLQPASSCQVCLLGTDCPGTRRFPHSPHCCIRVPANYFIHTKTPVKGALYNHKIRKVNSI